jgi:membrane fusion protein, multidrug efflux system
MKKNRTRIILIVILIVSTILIVFKLRSNKKEVQNNIAYAQSKIDRIPVVVTPASTGVLSENVVATGTLEPFESLSLVSETQGKIIKIYKQKGDRVVSGEAIVKVDDEVIAANVLTAEANYTQYQKDVDRLTRLSGENAVTKRDLEQVTIGLKKAKADLINAKKALNNTCIKSPINGFINSSNLTIGQFLAGGSSVCEIVNNNSLKLNIKVSESEVYKISKGQNVSIRLTVFPDKQFSGRITAIAEKADAAMKFNVEITLNNNANTHLRSGLYAEAELPVKNQNRVIIPKACIVGSMESPVVFIAQDSKAVKRTLIIGQSNDKQVEVLSGLSVNEQIIINGQLNLKNGDQINIVK